MFGLHTPLRAIISAIGKASVQRDCTIPETIERLHSHAVAAMEKYGLLYRNSNRPDCSLSSMATVSVTSLSQPLLVRQEPLTAFEGRLSLVQDGWELVDVARECSIGNQRMMRFQCAQYYNLLRLNRNQLLILTEENSFSHSQKWNYYTVVHTMCSKVPFVFRSNSLQHFLHTDNHIYLGSDRHYIF